MPVSVLFNEPKLLKWRMSLRTPYANGSFSALQRAENSSIWGWTNNKTWFVPSFSALQRAENSSIAKKEASNGADYVRVSVLFSEPKIPQWKGLTVGARSLHVSVLFSEPKIPQFGDVTFSFLDTPVSVLFSEPKIPQSNPSDDDGNDWEGFSALQRAENSSMLNRIVTFNARHSFSALQRAENSSMVVGRSRQKVLQKFQCSSASRKFLNRYSQRVRRKCVEVSVLFSEPKIPQSKWRSASAFPARVSVLFSEPKIPQSRPSHLRPSIFPTAMITLRHS